VSIKVLIIGGTGNISTGITRLLLENGYDVTLYNRGNTTIEGVKTIRGDRTDYSAFESQMSEAGSFDCLIDMVAYHTDDVRSAIRAFGGKVEQYIFCSTVDVYTKPARSYPVKEDAERKPDPKFTYAYNKALCEQILEEAYEQNKFQLTIIRPAATYNDSSYPISFLGSGSNLLKRIEDGKPITVLGDGTSLWVSSHRDDVAIAFVGAIGNSKAYGRGYNVTGDEVISWQTYYQIVAEVMKAPGLKLVCIPADLLVDIVPQCEWCMLNFRFSNLFDNTLAKKDLGYEYTITWQEGVKCMIAYHRERGEIVNSPEDHLYDVLVERFGEMKSKLKNEMGY